MIRTTFKPFSRGGRERFVWLVGPLPLSMTLCIVSGIVISEVTLPELGSPVRLDGLLFTCMRRSSHRTGPGPLERPRSCSGFLIIGNTHTHRVSSGRLRIR